MKHFHVWSFGIVAALAIGCGEASTNAPVTTNNDTGAAATTDSTYLLKEKPADAQGVAAVRESSESDQEVTVVGRIGGSPKPFVEGLAAFTIVDPALSPCPAEEGCPTPWDYCCDTNLTKENMATVKILDAEGQPVETDARQLLGVKELSTVIVRGKTQRDDAGNLTVLAEKVHVVSNE